MCQKRARQVHMGTDSSKLYYIDKDGILQKLLEDNEEVFQTTVLPKILIDPILQFTIQQVTMGSNGSTCQLDSCTIGTI